MTLAPPSPAQEAMEFGRRWLARPMSPEEEQRFEEWTAARPPIETWEPWPRQREALESEAFETLYGGAAGGAKTNLLCAMARLYHKSSVLFRRTYKMVEDSFVIESMELYGDPKQFNRQRMQWEFQDKCVVRFRHLENAGDEQNYQSAQFDLIAFDELTHFLASQYLYLVSRGRVKRKRGQPQRRVRIMAATNPGGLGNEWVFERWRAWLDPSYPNPAKPGELRWFCRINGKDTECEPDHVDEEGEPDALSRTYVKALLKDNPSLGPEYRRSLSALPEPFRSQLLDGDWLAGMVDDAYAVFPRAWVKAAMARWTPQGGAGKRQTRMAQDPSRGGPDRTVTAELRENWIGLVETPGEEVRDGDMAARLVGARIESGVPVLIDVVGVGSSAFDAAGKLGFRCKPFNGASSALGTDRTGRIKFSNRRAEGFWKFREALDPDGRRDIALPDNPELFAELVAMRYEERAGGIKITDKDELREILGRSPDKADALSMLFAEDETEAFGLASASIHGCRLTPLLEREERGVWGLRLAKRLKSRPGVLARAVWRSRTGESGAVWVHVDEEECWTVFRAWRASGALREFARGVLERSREAEVAHEYDMDLWGCEAEAVLAGGRSEPWKEGGLAEWCDYLVGLDGDAETPVGGVPLRDGDGLERLDGLLLGTLARFPEAAYWKGRPAGECRRWQSGEMITLASEECMRELEQARMDPKRAAKMEECGPLVQCLRLLAAGGLKCRG